MDSKTENPGTSPSQGYGDGTSPSHSYGDGTFPSQSYGNDTSPSKSYGDGTKTGAVVCVKTIPGIDELEYKALLFITDIPLHTSDRELEKLLGGHLKLLGEECHALLVRADINATSNEVAEQFNFHEDNTQRVSFETFSQ